MKKCQICGNQNSDDMRFCLNCGKPLPDAPMVFNIQDSGSQGGQSSPGTNPYGKSMETQFGARPNQPPQNYSMVPPAKQGGGSNKKIFIAIGGIVALFLLIFVAVAGIVGYNLMKKKDVVVTTSPTPTVSPSGSSSASPSPSPSSSKSASPTPKPSESPKSSNFDNVKVKFNKVWVDYNKTEDGELGMWVHLKFDVTNMKDVDSYAIVYFQKSDGTSLDNGSGDYQSKDGRVAALKLLKPGFDTTVYQDLDIFMPYSQLNLSSGKYKLKMDIDLTDNDQNLIEHLTYKEFEYEKD
jgi:zinc-ribbon domain